MSDRQSLIETHFKETLFKYIGGMTRNAGEKLIAVNGMADHVHIFVGLQPTTAVSYLVKNIKIATSRLINDNNRVRGRFSWQEGYGAFSYSLSHLSRVASYIENQEHHRERRTFRDE